MPVDPHPETPTTAPASTRRARVALWVLAPVFFVGLLIGAVAVGLLAGRSSTDTVAAPVTTTVTSTPPTTEHTVELVVNDACVTALRAANDLVGQVGQLRDALGQVIKQFSTAPMEDVLQRIDGLQQSMRAAFTACHLEVHLPDGAIQATDLLPASTSSTG